MLALHPAYDADRPRISGGVVPGIFERLPATLQKQPLLRVHQFRFARIDPKEFRIKLVDIIENRPRANVIGVPGQLVGARALRGQTPRSGKSTRCRSS